MIWFTIYREKQKLPQIMRNNENLVWRHYVKSIRNINKKYMHLHSVYSESGDTVSTPFILTNFNNHNNPTRYSYFKL